MKIEDKVIVLTGAGSGIGRELVLHLLSRGARVAGVDINPDSLQETKTLANCPEGRGTPTTCLSAKMPAPWISSTG